jgi:hypothetical protein
MGLCICYALSLPAETPQAMAGEILRKLREKAIVLPFAAVSDLVRLGPDDLRRPSPLRGLSYVRLEDVVDVHARFVSKALYCESQGLDIEDVHCRIDLPDDLTVSVVGFAAAPGSGSEPASFALAKLEGKDVATRWWWYCSCKTQYASAHGDAHLVKCHRSVVDLLDAAARIGLECDVRDETEFFASRDESKLLANVDEMNRVVAQFAGLFSDSFDKAGGDSRQVQGEIFHHPDFERLETAGSDGLQDNGSSDD